MALFLSVFIHHLLCDIFLIAEWRCSTRLAVRASSAATPASTVFIERTRAASFVARDRILDDLVADLGVVLGALGLSGGNAERQRQDHQPTEPLRSIHGARHCIRRVKKSHGPTVGLVDLEAAYQGSGAYFAAIYRTQCTGEDGRIGWIG
jgi:hypothetical protein